MFIERATFSKNDSFASIRHDYLNEEVVGHVPLELKPWSHKVLAIKENKRRERKEKRGRREGEEREKRGKREGGSEGIMIL